jgi:hypothetical protein
MGGDRLSVKTPSWTTAKQQGRVFNYSKVITQWRRQNHYSARDHAFLVQMQITPEMLPAVTPKTTAQF